MTPDDGSGPHSSKELTSQNRSELTSKPRIAAIYDYTDSDGTLLYQSVRYEPKSFRQRRPDGKGGWIWNLQGVERTLYHLRTLNEAKEKGKPVVIAEGEKDVHTFESLGYVATTSGSANTWKREFAEHFRGMSVVLSPDNDKTGRDFMAEIAADLLGIAEVVAVLQLPGLLPKEDITDWLETSTKEEFDELIASNGLVEITSPDDIAAYITGNVTDCVGNEKTNVTNLPSLTSSVTDVTDVTANGGIQETLNGAEILDEIEAFLAKYVAFPSKAALTAVVLWAVHTWIATHFFTTPRLYLSSAEKGSGKTRALECLENICYKARQTINTSVAAMFRRIEAETPTIILDEVDTVFSEKSGDSKEDLRGILNAGSKKGAVVDRCEGRDFNVKSFKVFTPVVMAGIGDLPDTIMSRSVVIRMKRRSPDEVVSPYRERVAESESGPLRLSIAAWTSTLGDIGTYYPDLPAGIEDRNAEVWEPLISIADKAGGAWPAKARSAALELINSSQSVSTPPVGNLLLGDIKKIFETTKAEKFSTHELLKHLQALEESPWADYYGKPLDARNLAKKLKPYGISSKTIRTHEGTIKGFDRESFMDAWKRYLARSEPNALVSPVSVTSVTSVTPQVTGYTNVTAKKPLPSQSVTNDEIPPISDISDEFIEAFDAFFEQEAS